MARALKSFIFSAAGAKEKSRSARAAKKKERAALAPRFSSALRPSEFSGISARAGRFSFALRSLSSQVFRPERSVFHLPCALWNSQVFNNIFLWTTYAYIESIAPNMLIDAHGFLEEFFSIPVNSWNGEECFAPHLLLRLWRGGASSIIEWNGDVFNI